MKPLLVFALLLLAVHPAPAAEAPFAFVVLGDRTGEAKPAVFQQILAEIALFRPDFILCTGDLIEGYAKDAAATRAQWDTVLAQLKSTGIPFHIAPGNHDIFGPSSESVFTKRVGRPYHSFRHGSSDFILLDNSRWPAAESLPQAELRWLDRELGQAKKSRHAFVLMHRPWWRDALDKGRSEPLHDRFKAAGIDYVFTGHDHFYCTTTRDGIRYFQVGPSGSRTKASDDPTAGAFQNYLLCRISGDTVATVVREPGRDKSMPIDTVTYESIRALNLADKRAVALDAVPVPDTGPLDLALPTTVRNVTARAMTGKLTWRDTLTAWRVKPHEITFSITPEGHVLQSFKLSLASPDSLYPLPAFSLPYEYAPGKKTIISRSLPIRREARLYRCSNRPLIDGLLTDSCWQATPTLRVFGDEGGGTPTAGQTEVWIARDDSLLYIAARCTEDGMQQIKADVSKRDGKVYEDDNVNLLLDLDPAPRVDSATYYQVMVNAIGTVADRVCRFSGGDSRKDYSWNGDWQVATGKGSGHWTIELSCPLADFGKVGEAWGVNASRFQPRTKTVAVWQVPFKHDPDSFGVLK